jgi:hypothetical protein
LIIPTRGSDAACRLCGYATLREGNVEFVGVFVLFVEKEAVDDGLTVHAPP